MLIIRFAAHCNKSTIHCPLLDAFFRNSLTDVIKALFYGCQSKQLNVAVSVFLRDVSKYKVAPNDLSCSVIIL
uniref:Uncharacterized protein n=1 Tax=Romanomermis culicivorax TaxID=13658 RepID=A0A915KX22_ROMCU